MIQKFIWRGKRPRIANTILKDKNKVGRLILSDIKCYCMATVIRKVWDWPKKEIILSMEQDRGPQSKPIQTYSTDIWQRSKGNLVEKWGLFSKQCWDNLNSFYNRSIVFIINENNKCALQWHVIRHIDYREAFSPKYNIRYWWGDEGK